MERGAGNTQGETGIHEGKSLLDLAGDLVFLMSLLLCQPFLIGLQTRSLGLQRLLGGMGAGHGCGGRADRLVLGDQSGQVLVVRVVSIHHFVVVRCLVGFYLLLNGQHLLQKGFL